MNKLALLPSERMWKYKIWEFCLYPVLFTQETYDGRDYIVCTVMHPDGPKSYPAMTYKEVHAQLKANGDI